MKYFEGRSPHSAPDSEELSSPIFSTTFWKSANFLQRKKWKKIKNCRKYLCQLKCISVKNFPAGKGLWKTLWRMWKSQGFQQLFAGFFYEPDFYMTVYAFAYRPVAMGIMGVMLPIFGTAIFLDFGEKVDNSSEWVWFGGCVSGCTANIFVTFSQKPQQYDFLLSGNTVTSFCIFRRTVCRGK